MRACVKLYGNRIDARPYYSHQSCKPERLPISATLTGAGLHELGISVFENSSQGGCFGRNRAHVQPFVPNDFEQDSLPFPGAGELLNPICSRKCNKHPTRGTKFLLPFHNLVTHARGGSWAVQRIAPCYTVLHAVLRRSG